MNKKIIFFLEYLTETFSSYFEVFKKNNFETKVFKLEKKSSLKEKVKYIRSIISELKSFKPDFLYINDEIFSKNVFIIILLKKIFLKKAKIIDFVASRYISRNRNLRGKFLIKNSDYIFCRSNLELEKLKKEKIFSGQTSKLHKLYWGFPKETFFKINKNKEEICNSSPLLKNIYPRIKNKYVLGFVGRISGEKGIDLILEALRKLPEKFIFFWVGAVDDQEYYEKLSDFIKKNSLAGKIIYLGPVPNPELRYVYNVIDLLILPTTQQRKPFLEELFGAVLAEAMLCQIMVMGSDNGAIPEVINKKELIFKENNVQDLLRVINYIFQLEPREKERITKENYQRAIDNFSCEPFVKEILKFL